MTEIRGGTGETDHHVENLAQEISSLPVARALTEIGRPLLRLLIQTGKPVSAEEIAEATGRPREQVAADLAALPSAERDQKGRIIGVGLTLNPTPHRLRVDGKTLYTWCALDALAFPAALDIHVLIESPCPKTGQSIVVEVDGDQLLDASPRTAAVSLVDAGVFQEGSEVRAAFCDHVHFFSSKAAAETWPGLSPRAVVVNLAEALRVGRALASFSLDGLRFDGRVSLPSGMSQHAAT